MALVTVVSTGASIGTIIGQVLIVVLLIIGFVPNLRKSKTGQFIANRGSLFAFIVAIVATIISLTYSEVIGFTPCRLCWFQRIMIFPQVILLGFAWFKGLGKSLKFSIITMASIGVIISLRHYILQVSQAVSDCGADAVSCSANYSFHFGYITIPMMALTTGLLIIILMWRTK
ncbi:MAG: disulfide bond formation protein B [Candidatus Nomurabacteria bacterium]|nr:disulfide bond formation protein B [Candidatus Nomurabacteria bacterium]